ncbi:MAG: hypothetical protein F6K04_27995 [Leptolyngbya sp. SIO4C5]|nr:hypothetical protein [Leptolyngbya sp. SIO4C5]
MPSLFTAIALLIVGFKPGFNTVVHSLYLHNFGEPFECTNFLTPTDSLIHLCPGEHLKALVKYLPIL